MARPKKPDARARMNLDAAVVKRLRRLAAHLDRDPNDYASELLARALERDERRMFKDIDRERKGRGGG